LETTFRSLVLTWLLALCAGIGLGLFVARYVLPTSYTEAQPSDLSAMDKADYLRMIASSYAIDNSFDLARLWLQLLQLPDVAARLGELASEESNGLTQQALVRLRLDLETPNVARARATSTARPTRDPIPKPPVTVIVLEPTLPPPTVPLATRRPTGIPPTSEPNPYAPRFELGEKRALGCADDNLGGNLRVEVLDAAGRGLSGMAVEVNSALGNDQFLTGLKPEGGSGYGDAVVAPGTYSVHLVENGFSEIVGDLRIDANVVECSSTPLASLEAVPSAPRGWHLVFQQARAQ
jgi:hypothetical protein